jgi:hypothetical protein
MHPEVAEADARVSRSLLHQRSLQSTRSAGAYDCVLSALSELSRRPQNVRKFLQHC